MAQVGSQSISPLLVSIESGNMEAAKVGGKLMSTEVSAEPQFGGHVTQQPLSEGVTFSLTHHPKKGTIA